MELFNLSPWILISLLGAGMASGFLAGLFGIGGGVILVPTFLALFPHLGCSPQHLMHMAVGTCLALIVPTAYMASRKQYRMGMLDLSLLKTWIPAVLLGMILGVFLLPHISSPFLKKLFTGYLVSVSLYTFFSPNNHDASITGFPHGFLSVLVGFVIGTLSVLIGIGGGSFTVPYWQLSGYPLKKAIAISTATSFFIGLGGSLGTLIDGWSSSGRPPLSLGFVYLPGLILLSPLVMIFAPLGARSANQCPKTLLKNLYTAFLILMSALMLYKSR